MSSIGAMMKRELRSIFNSPIAYAIVIFAIVFTAAWLFFVQQFFAQNEATLRNYFGIFPTVFVILIPSLTMRSWAEEKKLGTDELLMTLPVPDSTLVLGKFLSGLVLLVLILLLTVPVPLTVLPFGFFDYGQIIGEYLGVLFLGAACLAVGYFISSLSTNQTTAFLVTVIILMVFTFIGEIPKFVNLADWIAAVLNYLSFDYHFQSFRKGIFDTRDASYFILLSFIFIYANMKVITFLRIK
jgi:ABC-2 type transport system permease protein